MSEPQGWSITCNIALRVTLHYLQHCVTYNIALRATLHYLQHCIETLLHSDWSSLRWGCKKRCANLHPFETCLKQGLICELPFTAL